MRCRLSQARLPGRRSGADSAPVPNSCLNDVDIVGDPDVVAEVREAVRGSYPDGSECAFDLNRALPPPAELGDDTGR